MALVPAGAQASFPGKHGRLVLSLDNCEFNRYLATVPWKGGELTPITELCDPQSEDEDFPSSFAFPEAAPDGRSILAVQNDAPDYFGTLNPDGSGLTPLTLPAGVNSDFGSMPSFAPNGRRFAFEADRYQRGYDQEPLREVQLDGSASRVIRKAAACKKGENCATFENPRWSPDGKLIAVEVSAYVYKPRKPGAIASGIWLIRAKDGKLVRRLTKHGTDVDWSPDGKQIVYRTHYQQREIEGGASGGNMYLVSRDGKRKRKLVHRHDIAETQPTWSPDGRWIAWVSMDFSSGDVGFDVFPSLWHIRVNGGKPKRIQKLPEPYVEEGEFEAPQLTWLPAPN